MIPAANRTAECRNASRHSLDAIALMGLGRKGQIPRFATAGGSRCRCRYSLSCARADHELPPNRKGGKGFVSCLVEQLHYEFKQRGVLHDLEVWRDTRKVAPGDQFDHIIEEAIRQSNLFVAVLSPNWMEERFLQK